MRCYCNAPTPYHIILSTVGPFALTPLKCIMLVKYGSGSTYMNSPTPLWDVVLFFHLQEIVDSSDTIYNAPTPERTILCVGALQL